MDICVICGGVIDENRFGGLEPGAWHPECLTQRLPEDAISVLVAVSLLVLAPLVIVWAA